MKEEKHHGKVKFEGVFIRNRELKKFGSKQQSPFEIQAIKSKKQTLPVDLSDKEK